MSGASDSDTPVWFMDVDGVLNALPLGTPPKGYVRGKASPYEDRLHPFPICWNPEIISRIRGMHDDGLVRITWLTTWGSAVNFGLCELIQMGDDFEIASEPPLYSGWRNESGYNWWKFDTVQKWYAENPERKYVWTDDDLRWERAASDWVTDTGICGIAPMPHRGLTHEDLDRIESYLKTY